MKRLPLSFGKISPRITLILVFLMFFLPVRRTDKLVMSRQKRRFNVTRAVPIRSMESVIMANLQVTFPKRGSRVMVSVQQGVS